MSSIRRIQTPEEREAVYRFRYEVLVDSLGHKVQAADHRARMIHDQLDKTARIFAAWDESGRMIGTVRTNFARETIIGWPQEIIYAMAGNLHIASFSTRMVIAQEHQSSILIMQMATTQYELGLEEGIGLDFVTSYPEVTRLYEKLGYRDLGRDIPHPDAEKLRLLVHVLHDLDHLRGVRSPFAKALEDYRSRTSTSGELQVQSPLSA